MISPLDLFWYVIAFCLAAGLSVLLVGLIAAVFVGWARNVNKADD